MVIPPLFGVRKAPDFIMLTRSMSVKVKVSNERMRPTSNDAHNEMNDTNVVRIGYSRSEIDLSNDTRSFLIIAQRTR